MYNVPGKLTTGFVPLVRSKLGSEVKKEDPKALANKR